MIKIYEKFKEWDSSRNMRHLGLTSLSIGVAAFYTACSIIDYCAQKYEKTLCPIPEINFKDIPIVCNIFNNTVEVVIALIFVVLFLLYVIFIGKKRLDVLNDLNPIFKDRIKKTNKLRVFASDGSRAKGLLLQLQNEKLTQNLEIEVLLRSDPHTSTKDDRYQANLRQIARWESDIDKAFSKKNKVTVSTTFAMYNFPIMLSGFIFDEEFAMLAWYSRVEGEYRSIADPPLIYLNSSFEAGKKLIDDAAKVFDCHFALGKV
jgi:hypothetical protein